MATENLSAKYVPNEAHVGLLLSAEQRSICEQVAAGDSLDSRRARALLSIDSGSTQAEAGRRAGLTSGQVYYCLRRFRQDGLAIFPDVAPVTTQPELAAVPDPVSEPEPLASAGGAETEVEKADKKAGQKVARGKKKSKKSKKQGKAGKKKSKSAKASKKKDKKKSKGKGAQKGKKKSKKSKKQGKAGKKKSKSAKASKKKSKKKGKR